MLKITKVIEKNVEINLYVNLLFGLIMGLFFVSAGLFLYINKQQIIPTAIFTKMFKLIFIQIIGIPINKIIDVIRHIQLFVACIPKEGILNILYINKNVIISLKIPRIIDKNVIVINFEIVIYSPVRPYLIFSILSLL